MRQHQQIVRSLFVPLALVALLGACGKKDDAIASNTVGADTSLPQACLEFEDAQRACTENQAAGYERVGQPAAAKLLRDALPKALEDARAVALRNRLRHRPATRFAWRPNARKHEASAEVWYLIDKRPDCSCRSGRLRFWRC